MPVALLARCPDPVLPPQTADQNRLMDRVSGFARSLSKEGTEACFGLELRAAYLLEMRANAASMDVPIPPYRQFFLRPAVEPILYSYLGILRPAAIDPAIADSFMSCLHGIKVERRSETVRIKPNAKGHFVQFPDAAYATDYHLRLRSALPSVEGPLNRAALAYAEILLSHPYADGNGRLARAVALLCMNEANAVPFLPLGPAFYSSASRIAHALETLAATANWPYFVSAFCEMVEEAVTLGESILGFDAQDRKGTVPPSSD